MSAIILAGGISKRFGQDKGLVKLAGKPLIILVLEKVSEVVDEIVLVVNSDAQKRKFAGAIGKKASIVQDRTNIQTPLVGAVVGFETVQSDYALLLACDTPYLSSKILSFLLEMSINKAAAIPRWPNGNIEPLQAAYNAKAAAQAAEISLKEDKLNMRSMIDSIRNVRYISTIALRQFDPTLKTFVNINTPSDLRRAEALMKHEAERAS